MAAAEEIFESFFASLSEDKMIEKTFLKGLKELVQSGSVDKTTLRELIEKVYSNASKD